MNKPSDERLTKDNEVYSISEGIAAGEKIPVARETSDLLSEGIRQTGEKIPVKRDERTLKEDLNDYIYMKPRRKKKRRSSSASGVHRPSRKGKNKKLKKTFISIVAGLLAVVLLLVGTVIGLLIKGQNDLFDKDYKITAPQDIEAEVQDGGKYVVYNGETYRLNENITCMLFMGVDKRNMEDYGANGAGGQADVIVLMAIDTQKGKTALISIPRDTMTDVAVYSIGGTYTGMANQQLCLAYAYGDGKESSCENVITSVRRIFYNFPIKSYFALDLDGIAAMNDAVGGVDVVSPETISSFVQGESYHLEGVQAESFVRSRTHERADANLLRMQRQQVYATSYMNKVISSTKKDITTPVSMFNASSPYSVTNLNASKIAYFAKELVMGSGMEFEMLTVPGDVTLSADEYAQYNVNEKEFYEQFLSVFYEKI